VGFSAPGDCPSGPASGVIDTEIQHLLNFRFISGVNSAQERGQAMRQMSIFG
jgi:hypothetical protein